MGQGFSASATPDGLAQGSARTLTAVAAALAAGDIAGRVIVPLSARALVGSGNAGKVVDAVKQIDETARKGLIIEMHDFAGTLSLDAVETATIPLLLFAGGFIARVPPGLDDATVFSNCNYLGLSIAMDGNETEDDAIRNAWALTAIRRLKLFVWNMPPALMPAAIRMEVFGVVPAHG